jgi:catecholate siderophore receptor
MKKSNRKAASRQDAAQYVAPTMAAFLLTMPFATSAWAAPAVEADTELSNIEVTAKPSSPMQTKESASNKFTAPLRDTPKTVQVITREVLDQRGVNSLEEALRSTPGITFGAGEGGNPTGDQPYIRGINSQQSISIDGLRDIAAGSRETFNVDQVEVIKGADSAFNGRGGAGGSISIETKKPQNTDFTHIDLGVGTDKYVRGSVDTNWSTDNGMAFRFNAMGQKNDVAGREGPENKHWGFAPSVAFGLDTNTRLTLAYYHYQTDDIPDGGVPFLYPVGKLPTSGEHVYRPTYGDSRENWYGMYNRDFRKEKTDQGTVTFEHDFNEDMKLRNVFRAARSSQNYVWTQPDDSKGNVQNGMVWRRGNARVSDTATYQNVTDLTGKFDTGALKHSYNVGLELAYEKSDVQSAAVQQPTRYNPKTGKDEVVTNCSAANMGVGAGSDYICTDLNNPNPNDPWLFNVTLPEATKYRTKTTSVYAFDTIEFNPQWLLNAGVRFDHYESSKDIPDFGRYTRTDNLWNYQLGLVYKPLPNGSIYANIATASTPGNSFLGQSSEENNIAPDGRGAAKNANDMAPEKTRSYEIGTKWDVLDNNLSLTGAIFRNEVTNARIVENGIARMAGEKVVDGFELGFTGRITENWEVFGGYTFMSSEQKKLAKNADGTDSVAQGRDFFNTPRHSGSLWTSYKVTPKFTAGVGMYAQSDAVGSYTKSGDAVLIKGIPGYARFDAMLSYQISKNAKAQLNVYNLADKEYYSSTYSTHYATLGDGRAAVASLKLTF